MFAELGYVFSSAMKPPTLLAKLGFGRQVLPGFHLSFGIAFFYVTALVLIPLASLFTRVLTPSSDYSTYSDLFGHLWSVCTSASALHSYQVSFGLSLVAALMNGVFGLITAWVLERYTFWGRRFVDALVDLPFAMPTSVAGIALTQIYEKNGGYIGQWLYEMFGIQVAYTQTGIVVALVFIGFPFVVRTLQPVIAGLSIEQEEAAACLGASRWATLRRVVFPALWAAWFTGVMMAFGRAVGEYGSVVFISANLPMQTEITPHLIVTELDQYDYVAGAGLGVTMLIISFAILGTANWVQHRAQLRLVGAGA